MRTAILYVMTLCLVSIISATHGSASAQNKVVVVPLISSAPQGISPDNVIQLQSYYCTTDTYCSVGLKWPETGVDFSYGVPQGKYFVMTSISLQPADPGTGIINGSIVQKKHGEQSTESRIRWVITNGWGDVMNFSPGIIIPPGYDVIVFNSNTSDAPVNVSINGYLIDK